MTTASTVLRGLAFRQQQRWSRWLTHRETYHPMAGLADWAMSMGVPEAFVVSLHKLTREPMIPHRRFIYDIRDRVTIEPSVGWIVDRQKRVLRESVYYDAYAPLGRAQLVSRIPPVRLPAVVSLRDTNEGNYWHFYDDILPKLGLLDQLGAIPLGAPLLVGRRLWESPYFTAAREGPGLRDRQWMPHDAPIVADRVVVVSAGSFRLDGLRVATNLIGRPPAHGGVRKVFLSRRRPADRAPANIDELERLAARAGYVVLDPAVMTLAQQAAAFSSAERVVAIHGAGLANLAWRVGSPCELTEILPADFLHGHFTWLAMAAEFNYRAIIGDPLAEGFGVDAKKFTAVI